MSPAENEHARMLFLAGRSQDEAVLFQVLDALSEGLAFYGQDGAPRFVNRAMRSLLESSAEAEMLYAELANFVRAACSCASGGAATDSLRVEEVAARELKLGPRHFRLRASSIEPGLFGTGPVLLVTLDAIPPAPLQDEELRRRFGLTQQEVRIARLLGEGCSNAQIAQRLHISSNTAQNHTWHVLEKLGLHSRAQVAASLTGTPCKSD